MIHDIVNQLAADPDPVLAALADPVRRRAVELLGAGPRRASELAADLGMGRPLMSRHLKVLRASGLVTVETPESDARARIYHLDWARVRALRAWMDRVEAHWTDQLGRFKRYAEAPEE